MTSLLKLFPLLCLILLNGCVVKNIGTTVEHTFKGDYYLSNEKYEQGRESFAVEVAENPESSLANYYYGRFLLQDGEYEQALQHLLKARTLDPENADYQFWSGIAFGAEKDTKKEEESYRRALAIDKNHLQSMVYLGHIEFRKKNYQKALALYSKALEIWPESPSALYNRALILHKLGRSPEERRAWLAYLSLYPSGAKARRATQYLNILNNFTYRNHKIGLRTITTEKIWFEPFVAQLSFSSHDSLNLIGTVYSDHKSGKLQIIVYQKNNEKLAREKAHAIKQYLLEEFPTQDSKKIGISWFAEPQKFTISGKKLSIDESVSFFVSEDS